MKPNYYLFLFVFIISTQSLFSFWTQINKGIDSTELHICNPVLIDDILYASSIGDYKSNGGLYSSSDYGKSWNYIGLKNEYILTVHKVGNNLFAGTTYNGVFFSYDEGKTWEQRNNGLDDYSKIFLKKYDKQQIPVHKILNIGNTLFLHNIFLYYSNDLGITWNKIDFGTNFYVEFLNVVNNQLFIQIYTKLGQDEVVTYSKISNDLGQNWQDVSIPYYWNSNPEFIEKDNTIYCCNDFLNIHQSDDNGQTWSKIFTFSKSNIISLGLYNNIFYAVTENGQVYYSNDNCDSFSNWNNSQLESGILLTKALISKEIVGYVEDIRYTPFFSNFSKLYTLKDEQSSWEEIKFNFCTVGNVWSIHSNLGNLYIRNDNRIYHSSNQGENWSRPENFPDLKINKIDTVDSDKLILVMDNQIAITNNSGQKWTYNDISYLGKLTSIHFYHDIFVCSTIDSGLFYSTNQGYRWKSFINNTKIKSLDEIFVQHFPFPEPYKEIYYYAYNQNYGLILTSDFEKELVNANSRIKFETSSWGLDYGSKIRDFTLVEDSKIKGYLFIFYLTEYISEEPPHWNHFYIYRDNLYPIEKTGNLEYSFKHYINLTDDLHKIKGLKNLLFAFPKSGGLFYSSDYGDNWIDKSSGAENVVVHDIIRAGNYLYIATTNGIFRDNIIDYPLSVKTETSKENLIAIYPNPTSDYIIVGTNGHSPLEAIEIFNIFGECVLVSQTPSSERKIDVSILPQGIYFLKLINQPPLKFIKL